MAENLTIGSIQAPGFSGLDIQDSSVQLSSGFALEAFNCVIDKYGRIGTRKGWQPVNSSATSPAGSFRTIFELVKDDGNVVISAANNKIYTGTATLTQSVVRDSTNSSDLSYTITDDNWQVVAMPYSGGLSGSAHAILVQKDHAPLVYHKLGATSHAHTGSYGFQRLGDVATLPSGYTVSNFKPNVALSAFGRLWLANTSGLDTQTIYFSDLQNPGNFTTGTAGYLDISTVIPSGDPIVSLAAHNGFLIIMCTRHIVIYENPSVPASMSLKDVIKGIGCIARDSVQSVAGTDILFLSETGVQSLQRVVQEKSLPFRDVSRNVRDDLIANVNSEDFDNIKAVYYPTDAFYLLSLPTTGFTYCFDTRGQLDNGAARVTVWKDINPTAFCVTAARQLYLGKQGYIGNYTGYNDNTSTYRWSYYTNFFDFDSPSTLKILKKLGLVAIGGGAQAIAVKWGFDYTSNYQSQVILLAGERVYEYGIAEYGIAEYSNGIALDALKINASGTGKVLQIGFESDINGSPLSIQKIDIGIKTGKTL